MVLSAAMQFFGTFTVAVNYARGASLAKEVLGRIGAEDVTAVTRSESPAHALRNDSPLQANAEVEEIGRQYRKTIRDIASQLSPKWYLTAGIIAYFLGAGLGLIAGIGSLYR